MASFSLPSVNDNPEGWGPTTVPEQFEGLPYLPFSKSDRLFKPADWTQSNQYQNRYSRYQSSDVQSVFSFSSTDDGSFTLIDNAKPQSKFRQRKFTNQYNNRAPRNYNAQNKTRGAAATGASNSRQQNQPRTGKKWRQASNRYYNRNPAEKRTFDPSINVKPEWEFKQQLDVNALTKLSFTPPEGEEIVGVGKVKPIDSAYLLVSARNEKTIQKNHDLGFFNKSTLDDRIIRNLVSQANVFGTDNVMSLLMVCPKCVYPWDIVVRRIGSKLFFEKREGSKIDYLTVNENSVDPPGNEKDSVNSANSLSKEATAIDQYFARQIVNLDAPDISLEHNKDMIPDDFQIDNPLRGYTYRKWKLSEQINLVVRCDVDAAKIAKDGSIEPVSINALNEYDPKATGVDWRHKIDTQPGGVFATELKNNTAKLSRWAARSILAGADQSLIGYVTRLQAKELASHSILRVESYDTSEFIQHIGASPDNMWGILKGLIEVLLTYSEGKYILVKEPNEPLISLYRDPEENAE